MIAPTNVRAGVLTKCAVVVSAVLLVAGCARTSTYEERMNYLRKVAQQGADTHQLLVSQEGPKTDPARCGAAWDGLKRPSEFPTDGFTGENTSKELANQIREFFVDSCVSGKPKPVPADPAPAPPPSPTSSPSNLTSGPSTP